MRLPTPPARPPRPAAATGAATTFVREAVHLPLAPAPAEVFRAGEQNQGSAHTPSLRLLVVPGNPGAGAFYTRFAEALAADLGCSVSVMSLLGHHPPIGGGDLHPPLTLAAQVATAAAFLKTELDAAGPGGRVAVVGHSIGATIGARAVAVVDGDSDASTTNASTTPSRVAAVAALMPYARFNEAAPSQLALRALTARPRVRGAAAAVASSLPRGLTAALVRATAARGWSCDRALPALLDFVRAGGPSHSFALAADEFSVLAAPRETAWAAYSRLGPRLAVFAAEQDHWFPRPHWDDVAVVAPAASFAVVQGAKHDFVTCAHTTQRVAAAVAAEVRRRL